jgi:arylsulfatase A-like enzyme
VGPEIPQEVALEGLHILDLTPTILSHLGVEPPAYMDGRVLGELCGLSHVQGSPSEHTS